MKNTIIFAALALNACMVTPGEHEAQESVFLSTPTYDNVSFASTADSQIELIAILLDHVDVDLVVNEHSEYEDYKLILESMSADVSRLHHREVEHGDIWARDNFPVFSQVTLMPSDIPAALKKLGLSPTQQAIAQQRMSSIPFGYTGEIALKFEFNAWAYEPFSTPETQELYQIDNLITETIATQDGIPLVSSPVIGEGGGVESNGAGTVLYSLAGFEQRQIYDNNGLNPNPLTAQQITDEIAAMFGTPHVIPIDIFHPLDGHSVLDGPLYLDMNGDGVPDPLHLPFTVRHTDNLLRFVNETTLLVAQLPQERVTNHIEQEIHDRLEALWTFIEAQTDQDGQPFTLIPFPDPGLTVFEPTGGDDIWYFLGEFLEPPNGLPALQDYDENGGYMVSAGNYINYVVANDVVIIPQFGNEDLDAEAITQAELAYPGKEVVGFFGNDAINLGGGGIHCITMHRPE